MLLLPLFYFFAEKDDAPGVIFVGLVVLFTSIVIVVFAAVLQKLLKNAIDIKSEIDLTIWGETNGNYYQYWCDVGEKENERNRTFWKVWNHDGEFFYIEKWKGKAIRLSTLDAICKALECQPGDIIEYKSDEYI